MLFPKVENIDQHWPAVTQRYAVLPYSETGDEEHVVTQLRLFCQSANFPPVQEAVQYPL